MTNERPLKGLRALIVEDEYFIADDLKRLLTRHGADLVKLSGSVSDALDQIQKDGFDFALIDINIRGEMAFTIADHLLEEGVPFAFVSGYERSAIPTRFNVVPNWGKPYMDHVVITGIQALWGRPVNIQV